MNKKGIIYLVEDNTSFALTIKKGLEKEFGFEVIHFDTGEIMLDYIEINQQQLPLAIVLDYYLNSINETAQNGGEILLKLANPEKRINPFRKVPVIMLTSANELKTAITLLKKGAVDYILKDEGFFENLTKTINNIINIRNYKHEIEIHKAKAEAYKKRLVGMSIAFIATIALLLAFFVF